MRTTKKKEKGQGKIRFLVRLFNYFTFTIIELKYSKTIDKMYKYLYMIYTCDILIFHPSWRIFVIEMDMKSYKVQQQLSVSL